MPDAATIAEHREAVAAAASASQAWPELLPLERAALPPAPVDALPPRIAAFVQAVAAETETPVDVPFGLALAVLAICNQRRYVVQLRGSHRETLSLWFLLLLNSGERKSAVYSKLFAIVKERQRELRDAGAGDRARAQATLASVKERLLKVTKEAGNKSGNDATVAACARDEAALELERLTRELPPSVCLLLDDVTPERFASIVAESGAVAVASDEGGVFGTFFGKYSDKAPTIDLLLKSHNGGDASVDRQGKERLEIVEPACSFALVAQHDVMVEMSNKREWADRGGPQRFNYIVPESQVGRRTGQTVDVPPQTQAAWDTRIRAMLPSQPNKYRADRPSDALVLRCDPDALTAFEAFSARLEPRLDPDIGDLGWTNGWAAKHAGTLARIAANLHLFEHGPSNISLDSMQRALAMAPYLEAHAVAALTIGKSNPAMRDARQLFRWLERDRPEQFTERDVYTRMFGHYIPVARDRAAAAFKVLTAYSAIRPAVASRADSVIWDVHPHIREPLPVLPFSGAQENLSSNPSSSYNPVPKPNPLNGAQEVSETASHTFPSTNPDRLSGKTGALGALATREPADPHLQAVERHGVVPTGISADGMLDFGVPMLPDQAALDALAELDPGDPINPDEWAATVDPHEAERPNRARPLKSQPQEPEWGSDLSPAEAAALARLDPGSPIPDDGIAIGGDA